MQLRNNRYTRWSLCSNCGHYLRKRTLPHLNVCTETVVSDAVCLSSACAVIALTVMTFFAPDVSAQGFDRLNSDALRCLQTGDRGICQRALNNAEVLQRLASSRQAYPCQTLLLGVQANLILQQLGDGRGDRAISDLQAARRGCPGL